MKLKSAVIVETLDDGGCLIVDEDAQQSHALGPEAAAVWSCLESGTFEREAIAAQTSLGLDTVDRALGALAETDLLEAESASSRREILTRAATIAGAAAGLQLIETVATPTPAAAQSEPDTIPGADNN